MADSYSSEITYWTSDIRQRNLSTCDIASMVVSKSTIFIGWGRSASQSNFTSPTPDVTLVATMEIKCTGRVYDEQLDEHIRIAVPNNVRKATKTLISMAPAVSHIAVSAFGHFEKLGRHFRGDDKYGVFKKSTNHSEWAGKNLYEIVHTAAKKAALKFSKERNVAQKNDPTFSMEPEVIVGLDVNIAALGEHWWHLNDLYTNDKRRRTRKISAEKINAQFMRMVRQSTTYVKISHSVNVGFTDQGWIGRGRHRTQMNAFLPRRQLTNGYTDTFPGSCSVHGDCIEGLVSTKAIALRLKQLGTEPVIDDEGKFILPEKHHFVWHICAEYVADMIYSITLLTAPYRIALGGLIFSDREHPNQGRTHFIELVRESFKRKLKGRYRDDSETPWIYKEMKLMDSFISYRKFRYPGVFGGLILARWDKTDDYPVPPQVTPVMASDNGTRT